MKKLDKKTYFSDNKIHFFHHDANILLSSDFFENRHCCLGNFLSKNFDCGMSIQNFRGHYSFELKKLELKNFKKTIYGVFLMKKISMKMKTEWRANELKNEVMVSTRDPGTDRSGSVRDFQNFVDPGPVRDFEIFIGPGPVRTLTLTVH